MKLTLGALAASELAINRWLDKRAFAPLAGLVLKLQCQDRYLFVLPEEDGLHLKQDWQGRVDCCLSAPASAWLALLGATDKAAQLQAPPFILTGKPDVALQLLSILQNQPLDLAHELSQRLGPLPAALLESAAKHSRQFARQAHSSLEHSLAEYLSAETALLPHRAEVQARFAELEDLQQRLDALQQRVNRL